MKILLLNIICIIFLFSNIYAGTNIVSKPQRIIVTATRTPVETHLLPRNVIIITKEDIAKNGFENIDEVLNYCGLVDVQSRHQNVQSDISIRGSTFEQSLIMLDGVVLNNPQTGHHNMNLPVTLANIERIEIMPGHSSSLYGSYGFGGTINFITKNFHTQKVNLFLKCGSFNTFGSSIGVNYYKNNYSLSVNMEKEKSDGFKYDTDYDIFKINISALYSFSDNENIKLYYGMITRDFGAYDFYTPGKNLPSQESIENNVILLSLTKKINKFYLQPKLYYNKSFDNFILTKDDPDYYQSKHYTDKYGADFILGCYITEYFILTTIINHNIEKIDSSSLGKHERISFSFGNEFLYNLKNFGINFSLRNDFYDNEKYHSPGIGFYLWLNNSLKLRGSYGFSYRMPSFTELYYNSPVNKGNENLKAEKNNSYEIGADLIRKQFVLKNTVFYRDEYNLIDWVGRDEIWFAENINQIKFWGLENEFIILLFSNTKLIIRNSYIQANTEKKYISKYALNYTKNQTTFMLNFPVIFHINTSINTAYKIRKEQQYAITSIYLNKEILRYYSISFKVKNIFNEQYEEIKGISQQGRQFLLGMKVYI